MLVLYFTNQALNLKAESCMQNQYNSSPTISAKPSFKKLIQKVICRVLEANSVEVHCKPRLVPVSDVHCVAISTHPDSMKQKKVRGKQAV